MKWISRFAILLACLFTLVFSQEYYEYTTYHLFGDDYTLSSDSTWTVSDSVTSDTDGIYWLTTVDTSDTVISAKITLERGGNDITVFVLADSLADTLNAHVYFGYYRGPELGWSWNIMDSLKTDAATIEYDVGGQTFGENSVLHQIGIKLEEHAAGRNKYAFRIKHFRWR